MSTFKIPEIAVPVTVKKPPVKVASPSQSAASNQSTSSNQLTSPNQSAASNQSAAPSKSTSLGQLTPQKSLQSMKSALPSAQPMAEPKDLETKFEPGIPDERWNINQSITAQFTASDFIAGDREIWTKGVILAMILGKPRCKSRGWR